MILLSFTEVSLTGADYMNSPVGHAEKQCADLPSTLDTNHPLTLLVSSFPRHADLLTQWFSELESGIAQLIVRKNQCSDTYM